MLSLERPQEWKVSFNVRGKLREVTVSCWLDDVDGVVAVAHTLAMRRLGPRIYGYAHFMLIDWSVVRGLGTVRHEPWGKQATIALWQHLQQKRTDSTGMPLLPFWYLAADRDDDHVAKRAA